MSDRPDADLLIVASHRRWIADDLATADVIPVVADPALDAPGLLPEPVCYTFDKYRVRERRCA